MAHREKNCFFKNRAGTEKGPYYLWEAGVHKLLFPYLPLCQSDKIIITPVLLGSKLKFFHLLILPPPGTWSANPPLMLSPPLCPCGLKKGLADPCWSKIFHAMPVVWGWAAFVRPGPDSAMHKQPTRLFAKCHRRWGIYGPNKDHIIYLDLIKASLFLHHHNPGEAKEANHFVTVNCCNPQMRFRIPLRFWLTDWRTLLQSILIMVLIY